MESLPKHPKQAEVIVYSKDYCPYCTAAKNLLMQKGVGYQEIDITNDPALQEEFYARVYPNRTVPQILVNGVCLGGYTDIKKLDQQGKLEALLFPNGR